MIYKPTGRPLGRPRTSKLEPLSIKVCYELLARVKRYADLHHQSISELARDGLKWRISNGEMGLSSEKTPIKNYGNTDTTYFDNTEILEELRSLKEVVRTLETRLATQTFTPQEDHIENTVLPEIHPQTYKAQLLESIKELHRSGMSSGSITARLNQEGTSTLSGRGKWNRGTVSKLLRDIKN